VSTPEERARKNIDDLLCAAGWQIQSPHELNLGAALGVAVREFSLRTGPSTALSGKAPERGRTGFADYLLFVERKAIGAVEAKAEGTPLSGIESQSEKYSAGLPAVPPAWRKPLPFLYKSIREVEPVSLQGKSLKRPFPPTSRAPSGCASPSSSARSRGIW
jgi:type I restriction enzyme R subunit